jgi:hypothetical protein
MDDSTFDIRKSYYSAAMYSTEGKPVTIVSKYITDTTSVYQKQINIVYDKFIWDIKDAFQPGVVLRGLIVYKKDNGLDRKIRQYFLNEDGILDYITEYKEAAWPE